MGPNNTKNSSKSVIFSYLTMNNLAFIVKNTKFDQETVSLLRVKTKSGAHNQLTILSNEETFCKHLHSSLISIQWGSFFFSVSDRLVVWRNRGRVKTIIPASQSDRLSGSTCDPTTSRWRSNIR